MFSLHQLYNFFLIGHTLLLHYATDLAVVCGLTEGSCEVLPHLVGTYTAFDIVVCCGQPTALQSTLAVVKITTLFSQYIGGHHLKT